MRRRRIGARCKSAGTRATQESGHENAREKDRQAYLSKPRLSLRCYSFLLGSRSLDRSVVHLRACSRTPTMNMDPYYLGMLVMVGVNKKKFKPSVKAMKERYYQMFRGKGGEQ